MNLRFGFFIWLASLLGIGATILASFIWLDRPIALFAHEHFRQPHHEVVDEVSHFPIPVLLIAALLSVVLGLRLILGRPFSWHQASTFVCSISALFTEATKSALKFIFGR